MIEGTTYQRWYDDDIFLMSLFYSLERMTATSLYQLVKMMGRIIDEKVPSTTDAVESLSTAFPIPKAFMENRRWYDKYPELKKILAQLYVLDFDTQVDIAHALFVPSQIIAKYELYCEVEGKSPDREVVEAILHTAVKHGSEKAMSIYGVYVDYFVQNPDVEMELIMQRKINTNSQRAGVDSENQ